LRQLRRHPTKKIKRCCNFPDDIWARFLADKFRIILKHVRLLKRDVKKRMIAMAACTGAEASSLQQILDNVTQTQD